MEININKYDFLCPITQQIFLDPVLASDGIFYEKDAILKWFKIKTISPITRVEIDSKLIKCVYFNNQLKIFLQQNPDLIKDQYKYLSDENYGIIYDCNDCISSAHLNYDYIFDENSLTRHNDELIKAIIDNIDNLYYMYKGWSFIHFICRYCNENIVRYLVDKNINLECINNYGWKPIHILCRYCSDNLIMYIIKKYKNIDLECTNNYGWRPIHYIFRYHKLNLINFFIDEIKNINLNVKTNDNFTILDLLKFNNNVINSDYQLIEDKIK
jgi:ankyrin repeat protein